MKKLLVLIAVLMLVGCASQNQEIINYRTKRMKFKTNNATEQQEAVSQKCRVAIDTEEYPPSLMLGGAIGAVAYGTEKKYAYQDCMAKNGYICTDDCAYDVK